MGRLWEIAAPFVAGAPAGVRVRTRLRVSPQDAAVLRAMGSHLGSLAGRDLAARCAQGRLDARGRAVSRRERKRALTAGSSSRWAGAITRASEGQWQLATRNLVAEQASLRARIGRLEARAAVPAGGTDGRVRGYPTPAERHAKAIRLKALRGRLSKVERRLDSGAVPIVLGGKNLLRKRQNLTAAGLTEDQWRQQWESARLFLTADGEAGKPWGNETIRFNPDEGWLELKLPVPLASLANRPHGRYQLSCPVRFSYRGDEVAAQAATGAVRYDITLDPASGRWYLDASWTMPRRPAPPLGELRRHPVVAVDVNAGHLAVAVVAPDGNVLGVPFTVPLVLGRRGLGHRAGRRANGNRAAPEDAARPAPARPRQPPATGPAPRKPATPRGPRQPPGTKTGRPHRTTAGNQAAQHRTGPPAPQDHLLHARLGTVLAGPCTTRSPASGEERVVSVP